METYIVGCLRLLNTFFGGFYAVLLINKRRDIEHTRYLILFFISLVLWSFSYFRLSMATNLDDIFFFSKFVYVAVPLSSLFLFYFVYEYVKSTKVPLKLYNLAVVPLISVILALTSSYQDWFISQNINYDLMYLYINPVKFGKWFLIHALYSYMLTLGTCFVLLRQINKVNLKNRKIIILLCITTIVFVILNILGVFLTNSRYIPMISLFAYFFDIHIFYYAILGDEDNKSLVLGKKNLINVLHFPILFFNSYNELLDYNSASINYFRQFGIELSKLKKHKEIFSEEYFVKIGNTQLDCKSETSCFKHKSTDLLFYYQSTDVLDKNKNKMMGKIVNLYGLDTLTPLIDRLKEEAYKDSLSSCFNRSYLEIQKTEFFTIANLPIALFVVDIDNLKQVNDELGHNYGDDYIKTVSSIVKKHIRSNDLLFRIGGDEFIILLSKMNIASIDRLLHSFEDGCKLYDKPYTVSFSTGVSIIEDLNDDFDEHFKIADKDMYRKKMAKKITK